MAVVDMMKKSIIPKKNRREIHRYLFREGVIVVKKDATLAEHPELKGIPNLHVMMTLRTLKSHNFVSEKFNWQHHYYILTDEGTSHLREVLDIPGYVHPGTHTGKTRPSGGGPRGDREEGWRGGDDHRPRNTGRGRGGGGFGRDEGYSGGQRVQA